MRYSQTTTYVWVFGIATTIHVIIINTHENFVIYICFFSFSFKCLITIYMQMTLKIITDETQYSLSHKLCLVQWLWERDRFI